MPTPDEIRSTLKQYEKYMCESNADGIAALFAENGTAEDPVGGARFEGTEAIRGFYAATSPSLQVEITGPICVASNHAAMPMVAELTMNDQKLYLDVIDVFEFDDAGKVTSMKAYWNPAEMRPTR